MKNSKPKTIELDPCMGIRVVYDPGMTEPISDSRGVFRWKRIFIGPTLRAFPPREQAALLIHEAGHCKLKHLEWRILWAFLLIFWPPALAAYCRKQEFQADLFTAHCGYGPDLARAFMRLRGSSGGPLHPPIEERIARLLT